MTNRLLVTTALGLVLGTGAFAQTPSGSPTNPSAQTQTNKPAPSTSAVPSAQNVPSTSTNTTAQTQAPAASTTANPSSPSSTTNSAATQAQTPNTNAASQTQANPTASPPAQAQTSNPSPAGSQAQQSPNGGANANTSAQTSNTNVNASININDQQRTRITESVARLNVQPLTNVNFSLSIGTVVPRDVRIETLPADVVEIVPQYRGYSFFMVRDEIVIVEPSTMKIVTVLPRSGAATAAAPAPAQRKVTFSERDREVIKKHASRPRTEVHTTTGSNVRTELRRGERVPETVEIEAFPEEVYRESPSLREYRYIHRDNRTYVVEPQERRIIEEID